jgi:hypothetical protein
MYLRQARKMGELGIVRDSEDILVPHGSESAEKGVSLSICFASLFLLCT